MKREYFCCGCGLFHWVAMYETNEKGQIHRIPYQGCPNLECVSHTENDVLFFAVDTYGYSYFSVNNMEFIDEIKWSSLKYAPVEAIEVYKKQGIRIVDED
jgi:hypothetical protein